MNSDRKTTITKFNLAADGLPSVTEIGSVENHCKIANDTMHTHGHSIEIIYCRRGSHVYESLGRRYPLRPGTLFISRPHEPHCIVSMAKWLATYYTVIRLPRIGSGEFGISPAETKWLRHGFATLSDRVLKASPAIPQLFRSILNDCMSMPIGLSERSLRLRLGVLNLLCEVLRCSRDTPQTPSDVRIETIIGEMRAHPEHPYPESLLLERCAMSSSKLNAVFKKRTGLPPHAFLVSCRVERAKEMLSHDDTPIAKISDDLGFPSSKHFATIFRQLTGTTPTSFRTRQARDGI